MFADSMVRGGVPLPRFVESGRENQRAWAHYDSASPIKEAKLRYTTDQGPWVDRPWETAPADLHEKEKSIEATIPPGTTAYYLDLIDVRGSIVSSPHEQMSGASRD